MRNQRPKVCVLGASFNTGNLGVSALTAGTIRCILERYPDADIFLLDYGRQSFQQDFQVGDQCVSIRFVNIRFSKRFYLMNNIALLILFALLLKLLPWKRIRRKLIFRNSCLRHIEEADLTASIAGGDSFSDIYGLGRLLYVALPQILVLLSGKKLILLPQTLGPFRGRFAKALARYILGRADVIYARDFAGPQEVASLLGRKYSPAKVKFCYDVAFVVDAQAPSDQSLEVHVPPPNGSPLVGLNVSGLLFIGGYTGTNMFGLKVDYEKLVYGLIKFFIEKKHARILLIPHVFGRQEDPESDSAACERIYESLQGRYGANIAIVRGVYNQSEIKHIIGRCDFVIGSRMHACIAALSQFVPAVSIAYSDKFIGVMETLGITSLVVDPRKLDYDEILASIDHTYEQRDSLRRTLERTMPQVRRTVLDLFYYLDEK